MASSALSSSRLDLSEPLLSQRMSCSALPNAAYAVLCASIRVRSLLDCSGSRPGASMPNAVVATVEAAIALPE
jgi:hypothetical protein